MPDREKVIKGLRICIDRVPGKYTCDKCPYETHGNECEIDLSEDALTLLKGQPEIVRCKDCKYAAPDMACSHESEWGNEISRNRGNPNWFCADGLRKEVK